MSYDAIRNTLKAYALWREDVLQKRPEKRLFPMLEAGAQRILPKERIIVAGPDYPKIPWGWMFIAGAVLIALSSD